MVDQFGGFEYALAAYNAGDYRVRDWQAGTKYRDVQEFVESIPFTETREYDPRGKRIETTWTFARGDERVTQVTSVRLYALDELTDLFAACGCTTFQAFDGDLAPFARSSDRLWLVATKG